MQRLVCSVFALVFTLCAFAAEKFAYEVAFTDSSGLTYDDKGIPDGWRLDGVGTIAMYVDGNCPPSAVAGETGLGIDFRNAEGSNILRTIDPVVGNADVLCDNVYVRIRLCLVPGSIAKDTFQIVISTNNFENNSYVLIGDPIEFEEKGRTGYEWVNVERMQRVAGLRDSGKGISVGVLMESGYWTMKTGYIQSIKLSFVASATPEDVNFEVDGEVIALDETGVAPILPSTTNLVVATTINPYPSDRVAISRVYCNFDRNGEPCTYEMAADKFDRTRWRTVTINGAIESGELLNAKVCSEYTSDIGTVGTNKTGNVAVEESSWIYGIGTKKGSIWVNEFTPHQVELCGTVNREYLAGWTLVLSNVFTEATYQVDFTNKFDFSANMANGANGVVGIVNFEDLRWTNGVGVVSDIPQGDYTIRLCNSAGIVEHETPVFAILPGKSVGMTGYAPWEGDGFDWSGASTSGIFDWGVLSSNTFGAVNYPEQGFKVRAEVSLRVKTGTFSDEECTNLSFVTVNAEAYGMGNDSSTTTITNYPAKSEDGVADIAIKGFSATPWEIPISVSANAFGWHCEATNLVVQGTNAADSIEVLLRLTPSVAVDDFNGEKLNDYWRPSGTRGWQLEHEGTNGVLVLDNAWADEGNAILTCSNFLSSDGKKNVSVSFDFKNGRFDMSFKDEFWVELATNDTFESSISILKLSNKRSDIYSGQEGWYRYQTVFALPEEFIGSDRIWLRLYCNSEGWSQRMIKVDNLRIAFEDVALPTSLTRTVEEPAGGGSTGFALDVVPQATGTVEEVSADLHVVLKRKAGKPGAEQTVITTNVVPFAFADGALTNDISLVDGVAESVRLSISEDVLVKGLGRSFLKGDEVSYFAAVHYNSNNEDTDPAKVWETRYFPDNAVISNLNETTYWIVEGDYGVNADLSANTFAVTEGDVAVSPVGECDVTTNGVRFAFEAYDADGITNVAVRLNGVDYTLEEYDWLATNAQVRVVGEFVMTNGLKSSTAYAVEIIAVNAKGETLKPATFTFVTLAEVPTGEITVASTSEVMLTVHGEAAGYIVDDPSWVQKRGSRTEWMKDVGGPNTLFDGSVRFYATNQVGGVSAANTARATVYTLAAEATKAPTIVKDVASVTVGADEAYASEAKPDGNPPETEYAVRVTTSAGGDALVKTNNVEVWKPLADWWQNPVLVENAVDLAATNWFSFVTRNVDGICSTNEIADATATNCWFDMTAGFSNVEQKNNGTVGYTLTFFDPAKGQSAKAYVQYRIDNGEWSKPESFDVTFDDLSATFDKSWDAWTAVGKLNGTYSFTLKTWIDSDDRSSEPAETSGTLDFAPPTGLQIVKGSPAKDACAPTREYSFTASATDDHTPITYTWKRWFISSWNELNGNSDGTGETREGSVQADGAYTMSVTAMDALGNESEPVTWSWRVDTAKPTDFKLQGTPENGDRTNSTNFTFEASAKDDTLITYDWTLDDEPVSGSPTNFVGVVTSEDEHTVTVQAFDEAGNATEKITRKWIVDWTAPATPGITGKPSTLSTSTRDPDVDLEASSEGEDASTTYYWLFGKSGEDPVAQNPGAKLEKSLKKDGSDDGAYVASVYAVDVAGNVSPTNTLTWTLDTVGPTITSLASTPALTDWAVTKTTDFFLEVEASDMTTSVASYHWTYSVNGAKKDEQPSGGDTYAVSRAEEGTNRVSVVAVDQAGNLSASKTLTWIVDRTSPQKLEISGTPEEGAYVNNGEFVFLAASDDATTVTYEWTLNGVRAAVTNFTSASYPTAVTAEGSQSVCVVATDAAGNKSQAMRNWTVDWTPPVFDTFEVVSPGSERFNAATPFVVKVAFNEPVTNFTYEAVVANALVTVGNGSVTNITPVAGEDHTYLVAIKPEIAGGAQEGTVSVQIEAEKVSDRAGNFNEVASAELSRYYDNVRPTVTELKSSTPDPFNAEKSPMAVTVTFSKDVTGFDSSDVVVADGNGTVGAPSGSGTTYTFNVTPNHDGAVTVSIKENAVTDAAGNGNVASGTLTHTYDTTRPGTPVIGGTPEANAFTQEPGFEFTASVEDETGHSFIWTFGGQTVTNAADEVFEGSVTDDGVCSVSVWTMDAAGNVSEAAATRTWTVDRVGPEITAFEVVTPVAERFNAATPFVVKVAFNEPVTNFTYEAVVANELVTVENGSVTNITPVAGEANTYLVAIEPEIAGGAQEGTVSVQIEAEKVSDRAGNFNEVASAELSRYYDTVRPTVTELKSSTPNPFNAEKSPMAVTVTFSKEVTGFAAEDVLVVDEDGQSNGTVDNVIGSAKNWAFEVTPNHDGAVKVSIRENAVVDVAGNGSEASSTPLTYTYDTTQPTPPVISGTPGNGVTTNDRSVNLTASSTDATSSIAPLTYHWTFNGVSSSGTSLVGTSSQGPNSVSVYAEDAAGNTSEPTVWNWTLDTTDPTVELASETPEWFNGDKAPMVVAVQFSEPVTNFTAASATVGNGSVTEVTGTGAQYTVKVMPTADGDVSVSIAAGVVADLAGNPNTASKTITRRYDTEKPTVQLTSETPARFGKSTSLEVTVTFSETVTGFDGSKVSVDNGTVTGVTGSGATYQVTVKPRDLEGEEEQIEVSVQIADGVVTDRAGNANVASDELTRIYDPLALTVGITSETPTHFNEASAPLVALVEFSKKVQAFNSAMISVENGSVSSVAAASGKANAYEVTVSPESEGAVVVQVPARVVLDEAGNTNEDASAPLTRIYDTTAPTVELASETPEWFNEDKAPMVVTVRFSEAVTNFTAESVTVANGTVSSVTDLPDVENAYVVEVGPIEDGEVTVSLAAGVVADLAGNPSVASDELTRTYDTVKPKVTLTSETPEFFNSTFVVLATFSEPVTNYTAGSAFTADSVSVVNGRVTDVTKSPTVENAYLVTVEPNAEGEVSVSVEAGVVTDRAGNPNEASDGAQKRTYDHTPPTVTLSSDTPDPFHTNDVFAVKVVFSEPVTNFTAGSLTVENGSVTKVEEVMGEDNTYLATINWRDLDVTNMTVRVEAGAVADRAGNTNVEPSNEIKRECRLKNPWVTLTCDQPEKTGRFYTVIVTFSEKLASFKGARTIFTTYANFIKNTVWNTIEDKRVYKVEVELYSNVKSMNLQIAGNQFGAYAAPNLKNEPSNVLRLLVDTSSPENPQISGDPAAGSETHEKAFRLFATADDEGSLTKFVWTVNGTTLNAIIGTNELNSADCETLIKEGENWVTVKITDMAGNESVTSARYTWTYTPSVPSQDVEFGGDICVKVDPTTGETGVVRFVSADFKPGATSSFTLNGFSASTQNLGDFQMWFVVSEALKGAKRHVKVSETATFDSKAGELTVTLPPEALKKNDETCDSLFIFGVDNENPAQ